MTKQKNIEHINYALVARTHPSMYLMHKYWARKPHNIVAEYIKHYSREGEIVLDPFVGSGVTAIEAIKLDRKAIAIDLDPMAIFITRMTAIPIDLDKFKQAFEAIKTKVKDKINELYKTKCQKCRKDVIAEAIIWEKNTPKEIRYDCSCSKSILWKKVTDDDLKKIKETEKKEIPYWYPKNELIWNTRINVHQGEKVYELFTKRNLLALSMIYNEIEKIDDKKIQDLMRFVFTSGLHSASKMKIKGAGWTIRGYWVGEENVEQNVWECFRRRYEKIFTGKEESISLIKNYREAKNFSDLKDNANILIKTFNTLELEKVIPPNSIDYVFTDPPYWDSVPYLELDYMYSSWLKFNVDFEDEIIISDSPDRDKTSDIYERMLKSAFSQIYKVLKPGKWMTVTFHNTDIKAWNAIISSCILAGFDLDKIIYQPPAKPSAKGLLVPYGSAVGDYYIRFRKPETEKLNMVGELDEERFERIVLQEAKRIIAERGEPTAYTHILNGIIVELKREGALLIGKQNPDDIMKEFLNKEFVLVDVKDEKGKTIGKKWWFKDPSRIPYLELVPLSDRVETAVVDVLRRKVKISFDDILQEIFVKFPNALTPETQSIKELLKEYAAPTKDGMWMLKPSVKSRETEHSEIIYYLALLGQKSGYDVWIGSKEQGESYSGNKLSKFVTNKNPIWRFIPTTNLDRIKQIDVIWHDDGKVRFQFEVENTTAITEAIVRGSNIPQDKVRRMIVIPEEREKLLYRKIKEPILNENIIKQNWKFIFYKDVKKFFEQNKRKKEITLEDFEKMFKIPKESREKQNSLKEYPND